MIAPTRCVWLGSRSRGRVRRGAVTLELILGLPVLIIGLFAVVEFGMFFANMQQVALACRVGAEEASETLFLPPDGDPVPPPVIVIVLKQLENSCIEPCAVILEYNLGGVEQTLRSDFDNDNNGLPDCPDCQEPASLLPVNSVRITICVELTELMPNCLAAFGFDLAGRTTQCSATFGRE